MITRINILKTIDRIFGPLILKFFPRSSGSVLPCASLKKILVIRPGGLGDAILLLPTLKKIAVTKHVKVDILCEPRNKAAFENTNFIGRIYSYQNIWSLSCALFEKYDAVIDTEQSHILSAVIARLARSRIKAGFDTNNRGKMYTLSLPYLRDQYEPKMFLDLFSIIFNLDPEFELDPPYFTDSLPLKIPAEKTSLVGLFPGTTVLEKKWPEKRWTEVIDWLTEKGFIPVLIGGPSEKKEYERIFARASKPNSHTDMINVCGKLSISQTARLFDQIALLISTDSGILHLAMLCDIPTVSLFGPSDPLKWAPKGDKHHVIDKAVPCSPCSRFGTIPVCPNRIACMMEISTEDVIRKIDSIIDKTK